MCFSEHFFAYLESSSAILSIKNILTTMPRSALIFVLTKVIILTQWNIFAFAARFLLYVFRFDFVFCVLPKKSVPVSLGIHLRSRKRHKRYLVWNTQNRDKRAVAPHHSRCYFRQESSDIRRLPLQRCQHRRLYRIPGREKKLQARSRQNFGDDNLCEVHAVSSCASAKASATEWAERLHECFICCRSANLPEQ